MRRIAALAWLLAAGALSGCQLPPFDPAVSDRLASVHVDALALAERCPAVNADEIRETLRRPVAVALEAARYRTGAGEAAAGLAALDHLAASVADRYAKTPPPGGVYCREAMAQVAAGADRLLQAYGGLK